MASCNDVQVSVTGVGSLIGLSSTISRSIGSSSRATRFLSWVCVHGVKRQGVRHGVGTLETRRGKGLSKGGRTGVERVRMAATLTRFTLSPSCHGRQVCCPTIECGRLQGDLCKVLMRLAKQMAELHLLVVFVGVVITMYIINRYNILY